MDWPGTAVTKDPWPGTPRQGDSGDTVWPGTPKASAPAASSWPGSPKASTSAPGPAKPASAPAPGPAVRAYDPKDPKAIVADVAGFTKQRAHEEMDQLRQRNAEDRKHLLPNPLHTVENIGNIAGVILSPIGGAAQALGERLPGAQFTHGGKRTQAQKMGDLAEFITPIPGKAIGEGAKAVGKAAEGVKDTLEAGRIARQAKNFKATKLPKAPVSPELAETAMARRPSEVHEVGPIVGDEKHPATRTANALYRLGGSKTADEIEMKQFLKGLPKEINNPKTAEALYTAIEQKMVDPNAKIPAELQPAYEQIKPLLDESTDIINELRASKDPDAEAFADDVGYVHRIKSGDVGREQNLIGEQRSPFEGKKSLAKTASAQKARKFFVLEDAKGQRYFQDQPDPDWKAGDQVPGSFNEPLTVKPATTAEIEANTSTRYQKDAIRNTVKNLLELRRAKRNIETLDATLADMKSRGVAMQKEWRYKDPEGRWQNATGNEDVPKGWTTLHDVPQFKGWYFDVNDPQVQELKDWLPERGKEKWLDSYDRINNFLLRSNFLSPFIHPKNIAEFWTVGRGGDWLHPQGYAGLAKTMPRAVTEVLTMGPAYRRYLREGSALMHGDAATQGFHASLVDKGAQELTEDPKTFAAMMKAFGLKMNPAEAYKRITQASHRMMWAMGDIMMLQRQLELEAKGLPIREAIRKAEEMIPNYRVPSQILSQRWLGQLFRNNRLLSIGRYHYNKLNAWGTMFKKIAKGSPQERAEAFGQFVVAAILGSAVIPAMDKVVKIATGNKDARIKRGGLMAVPDEMQRVASGDQDWEHALASMIDISPMMNVGAKAIFNKDLYRGGQAVIDPNASPLGKGVQAVEGAAGSFGPTNLGMEAISPSYGPGRMAASQIGVDLPNPKSAAGRAKGKKAGLRSARRREARDPLEQMVRGQ